MKRIIAAFAAVAAVAWPAAVFTCAGVAQADDYTHVPLLANRDVFPGPNGADANALVVSTPVLVKKGEMVRITGQLAVRVPGGHRWPEVDLEVSCFDQFGHTIPGQPGFGSGTNIGGNGAFQWNADMLLVAPPLLVAPNPLPAEDNGGSTLQAPMLFFCGVMVTHVDYPTTVLAPTPGQTIHGTSLEVSSIPDPGAQQWWWSPPQGYCPTGDRNGSGPSKCVYLGGSNPNSLSIFQNTWQASNDATVVDFAATGQNTVCFAGSGSCREIDEGPGDYSYITSWLKIQQLDQNSNPCGDATLVYSEDTAKGDAETDTKETLRASRYQHHMPVYYHATVPVSQLCGGSRTFATSLYTQLVGGPPIKFEDKSLNVINLERAPTTTVPDVIGLTQQRATAAIVAAGLYTGPPNNVTSTATPGTVLAQNSPGRTVEPVGSQVQITVSAGQTTVPDVLGDLMAAAEQSIRSAGLTPVTLAPITNCADESAHGKVQYQSPLHGVQVSLGAQVEIRTTYCNR